LTELKISGIIGMLLAIPEDSATRGATRAPDTGFSGESDTMRGYVAESLLFFVLYTYSHSPRKIFKALNLGVWGQAVSKVFF
jgi:hypothetical protein